MSSTVDIVIPTYRRNELLEETLRSVQRQTYEQWICWIAEDGCTDATHNTVKSFLTDARFRYLPGKHSGTPATPRNRALKSGTSEYIAFLDDDDIWLPEKLERQVAFMKSHIGCVLLGCNAFIMKEGQDYANDCLTLYFNKAPFGRVHYKTLVKDDYFINSSAMIRRSAFNYSGPQSETLHHGPDGEDFDLWLRIGVLGEAWLMKAPLVVYRALSSKHEKPKASSSERRKKAYHTKYKIYQSALDGVGDLPSPLSFPEYEKHERLCREEMDFYAAGPRFLGRVVHNIKSAVVPFLPIISSKNKREKKAIESFHKCRFRWEKALSNPSVACIVFSKDRALQLHALISSCLEKVDSVIPIHVLYQASESSHQSAYDDLISMFSSKNVYFCKQKNDRSFKSDLLGILLGISADRVFFLVDDIVFIEPLCVADWIKFSPDKFVPSLRLGKNLKRCYVLKTDQPWPEFLSDTVEDEDKIVWKWNSGIYDWSYPLSVDGHLFSKIEITAMVALLSFNAPNSFEDQLQIYRDMMGERLGIAYRKSIVLNIPINRVQNEHVNISGDIHQDELLMKWNEGYQMDYELLYGFQNESVHQEVPIRFKKRDSGK